jgi:molybdate transport system regulatory protein
MKARLSSGEGGGLAGAQPHVRIIFGDGQRIGPGKIDLLEAIGATGSISAAGRELGMSYRRAWLLVDAVNAMFARPVVIAAAGGAHGGGAQLTDLGRAVVAAYRRIENRARVAISEELASIEKDFSAR